MTKAFLTVFIALIGFSSLGQTNKEYVKTLKEMFEVSGSEEAYETVIEQLFVMYKREYTEVDVHVWDELEDEVKKTSLNELADMLAPVYSKYLTLEDLEDLIAFYKTPVGKKFAKKSPLIMQESMIIGQEWGRKIGENFAEKMEEKGY